MATVLIGDASTILYRNRPSCLGTVPLRQSPSLYRYLKSFSYENLGQKPLYTRYFTIKDLQS